MGANTLPPPPAVIHVPEEMLAPAAPLFKVRKPAFAMFAPLLDEGALANVEHNAPADGFDVRLTCAAFLDSQGECHARVDYNGAHDGRVVERVLSAAKVRNYNGAGRVTWVHDGHVTVDAATMRDALDYAIAAASGDPNRGNHLCGVHMWNGAIAASDGHRAHVTYSAGIPTDWNLAIPLHAAQFLSAALRTSKAESLRIGLQGRTFFARVQGGGFDVLLSVTTEKAFTHLFEIFENTAAELRKSRVAAFAADVRDVRATLATAPMVTVRRMVNGKELAPVTVRELTFAADGFLFVGRADDAARRTLAVCAEMLPENTVATAVNPKYIADVLANMSGRVLLSCGGEFSPVVVSNENRRALIMPVRL